VIKRLNRLIFTYLKSYWRELLAILVLQVLATAMSLYLPNLNAQIIDDGVVKGDTDLIWRSGALMLLFSLVQAAGQKTLRKLTLSITRNGIAKMVWCHGITIRIPTYMTSVKKLSIS